ncbi:S1 family peptidase [Sphingomonas alpina]|uniref:S1 family peptidase n=1 Tax=Sphingomonas alpina TaxID=653931 RepID=UPI001E49E440|nr:S1 family peptidase [Sphingomonas alpina]
MEQKPPPIVETPAEARARDGVEYARQFGVPVDEAIRRLAAQEESVAATDRIAETYRDRLAGIAIEHRPAYRIIVYLTGDTPVPTMAVWAGGMTVPILFRTGARVSRERVIWAMTWYQSAIRAALRRPPGMGLDPRTGELTVTIGTSDGAAGADVIKTRLEAIAGVPVQVRITDRIDKNLDIAGGARVEGTSPADGKRYVCTTGFTVSDGVRYGVTTAAHCLDALSYRDRQRGDLPLDFIAQWGWGYRDVQVNGSSEMPAPLFYADTAKTRLRPVTGQRGRAATRAGDFVCHRGERTGYSCALVELTDFAPAGDLCGGPCLPTWVTVSGPTCNGGDSGSPVFSGTTAFGMLKGGSYRRDGSCAFYFYMSVDYLPSEWSLLRTGPGGLTAGTTARGTRQILGAGDQAHSRSSRARVASLIASSISSAASLVDRLPIAMVRQLLASRDNR